MIENYEILQAEKSLHNLYTTAIGFSGGESFESFEMMLQKQIKRDVYETRDFRKLKNYGDDNLGQSFESFLDSMGI